MLYDESNIVYTNNHTKNTIFPFLESLSLFLSGVFVDIKQDYLIKNR